MSDDSRTGRLAGAGATGRNDNSVHASTTASPRVWIEGLPTERRVTEGLRLLNIFGEVTGAPAVMWGPSIVGYGHHHYVYDSGREGDTCQVGFSPRSSAISLYGLLGVPGGQQLLERLGPHRVGRGCLYVSSLRRVDETVLGELVRLAWQFPLDRREGGPNR